jgi:hypothetical protein
MISYNSRPVDIAIYYENGTIRKTTEWQKPRDTLKWLFEFLTTTYPADFEGATHVIMTREGRSKKFDVKG